MDYGTRQLLDYHIELPFYEQPKRLESHYTSLIFPLLDSEYTDAGIIDFVTSSYEETFDLTIKVIKDEFRMKITSGELISVLLQHPYFQSRWLSPRYCRDYDDSPLAFQDFFAGAIQNGITPKWIGDMNIREFAKLGLQKGKFSTTAEFRKFIENDLLPNPVQIIKAIP